ncbi:ABC transporter ATP-binding protein [Danxiaibacter flavus]|uniref:ABC transporter ATP-binding protein n=1 Tax=Danxiaibacter flavus TaxID=3049108 RepID=A0ABV3Z951_9BACT|nr:ABC transporter ATP-binding protein [Chitinophagaceae bacterium DXS]
MKRIAQHIFQALTTHEKRQFLTITFFDVLLSIADVGFMAALVWLTSIYSGASQFTGNSYFNDGSLLPVFILLLLFVMKNFFTAITLKKQYHFVYDVALRISAENLANYFKSDYTDYVQTDSAVYSRKISQEPIEFAYYVLRSLQQITGQVLLLIITVGAILTYSPAMFLLLFAVLAPPVVLCASIIKKKASRLKLSVKQSSEKSLQHLHEALAGFVEANLYNAQPFFVNRFARYQQKMNYSLAEQQSIQSMPTGFMEVFAVAGLFVLIALNKFLSGTTHVQIVMLGAFLAAAYKIIPGIVKILNASGLIKAYAYSIHPISSRNSDAIKTATIQLPGQINSIEFKEVSFGYSSKPILNNMNMYLESGDMAGIHGLSGKGKTTAVHLLLGFLSPSSGSIKINGRNTSSQERQQAGDLIAYVKQQPFIFRDSILNNITFGQEQEATTKVEHIISATGMQQIIENTATATTAGISDSGKNLSGGQRQRITIARALYKNADLIILDEPFKELDTASEAALLTYFQSLAAQGKIILLITHNKKSLAYCNKTIEIG